jgi:RND superfamily putative drug exporter
MFAKLGRSVVGHPWRVIGVWILVAAIVISFAPKLATTTAESSFLPSRYQSIEAMNVQEKYFPNATTPGAIVVFERADSRALTAADSAKVRFDAAKIAASHIPTFSYVMAGPPSVNHLVQAIYLQMPNIGGQLTNAQTRAVKTLRSDVASMVVGTGLKAGVTGTAAQFVDEQAESDRANRVVAVGTISLIIVLMLLIFRSPIITLLPVLTITAVSEVAVGLISLASKAFDLNVASWVTTMLIVVLFGIGTDYVLFLLFRYRERLRAGDEPKLAIVTAITRVGPAIATAAGAVIIAFLALTLSSLGLFHALGPALAIAVATTLLAGLTLIPAFVSLLGTRVFWPSSAWKYEPRGARFATFGDALGRNPGRFALASGGILVILAVFAFGFHPDFNITSGNNTTSESTVYGNVLLRGYPAGTSEPTYVYVESISGKPLSLSALSAYRLRLAAATGVAEVAPAQPDKTGTVAYFQILLKAPGESDAAMTTLRGPLQRAVGTAPPGTRALTGGVTSVFVDLQSAMDHDYSIVFPVAAVLILVILALLLRSVVAPWYLMAAVGLGFASTLGASVVVFQDIGGNSGLTFILPIVMYLFVVALGTDYNILMISRLREEAREGRNPHGAAAMALQHAGPTVASAGIILSGTFASLMLAGGTTLTQMGFATAFGIAVASFVMALFLTPGLTALIGHTAWWPGHSDEDVHGSRPQPDSRSAASGEALEASVA